MWSLLVVAVCCQSEFSIGRSHASTVHSLTCFCSLFFALCDVNYKDSTNLAEKTQRRRLLNLAGSMWMTR